MDINGNSNEDGSIQELKDWLFERISDDNDIIVDEIQRDFAQYFESIELQHEQCKGSAEYLQNIEYLNTTIAFLKTPEGRASIKVNKDKQKVTDGIKPCWYGGMRNAEGFPNGEGMLAYDNKTVFKGVFSNGVLDREGKLTLADRCGLSIEGKWQDGLMEGEMRVETDEGGWIEGYYHHGVPHGFQREFGVKEYMMAKHPSLRFFGRFYKGIPRGFCWRGLFGGGFLCGFVDPQDGSFTGKDLAFIYPDFKTALRGQFKNGLIVKAQICQLIGSKFERGICIPIFSKPQGQVYEFEEPARKIMAKNPLMKEPWETQRVAVKSSTLPQGGDGLFAIEKLPRLSLVAFYNGIRLNTKSLLLEQRFGHSDYRVRLNAEVDLDLIKGHESIEVYSATLGHKVNHSFEPNVEWILVEHPRFGLIRGLRAIRDISEGEEILVNYSINLADSPEWYRVVWLRHYRHVKKASDAAIKRILDRYEENSGKKVEIPESEELNIPDPQGIANVDDLPDDNEIAEATPKAEVIKLRAMKNDQQSDEEDMLPKIEEIE